MKGKITVVLFSLVLVFGMLAASCDNGAFPDKIANDKSTYFAYENVGDDLPVKDIDDLPKLMKGEDVYKKLQEITLDPTDTTLTKYIPSYKLDVVKTKAEWAALAGEDPESADAKAKKMKRDIAAKYAGMQIIIVNPASIPVTP